jgi:hypothetical protein
MHKLKAEDVFLPHEKRLIKDKKLLNKLSKELEEIDYNEYEE